MVYYDKIEVNKMGVNKTSAYIECIICHYWYFSDKGFRFQSFVCNSCHDVLMMSFGISNIAVLNIHGVDYRCIIFGSRKGETIKMMKILC